MSTCGSIVLQAPPAGTLGSVMVTLADVLQHLATDQGLDRARMREMCSAIRRFCRVLGAEPSLVPAEPRQLRPRLAKLTPAAAGVTTARWRNIKSLVLKAVKRAGFKCMAGRSREPLAPEWEALRALLPNRHVQSGLSRLMAFCTARGIGPTAVCADTFVQFGEEVQNYSLSRDPGGLYRDTCKLWNLAVSTILEWPQCQVPVLDRRRDFALTLDDFPSSFRQDVENFLGRGADPDVFSDTYYKPVAKLTLHNRKRHILMAATALVRTGVPISQITGLDVLMKIKHAKTLLRFLYNRAGDKTTNQIYHIATLLKTIARHHLHLPEETVDQMRRQCKALKPKSEGFTEKNRRCLRQFTDNKKLANLLTLGVRVIAQVARRDKLRRRDAVRVELAIAVAILLNIPLRAGNLAGLRLDRHLQFVGDRAFLSIPSDETKNAVAIDTELSPLLAQLLHTYIDRYRPILNGTSSPWLFPGENNARRPSGGFGQQLSHFIAREVGLVMTPHQFRHLAAKLFLDLHPNEFETVRKLLGHKSIETTMRFYRELDAALAGKRYAALLDGLLTDLQCHATPRRRKKEP
jgi:integrase